MTEIRFYRASEKPYGCFSNLFRRGMSFDGYCFSCAESAYQFAKSRRPVVRAWLMAAPSPALLALAAPSLPTWEIAPGWSAGRYQRMQAVVRAKFAQHADLAAILLATGDARLIESATVDNEVNRRWGQVKVGGGWVGKNWLGAILQEIRHELRTVS